ncbi:hypothetical protein CR513_60490, partial [Mucuna pruriens]
MARFITIHMSVIHTFQLSAPKNSSLHPCMTTSSLRLFGCACYPHLRAYNLEKLDFHSRECVTQFPTKVISALPLMEDFVSKEVIFNKHKIPYSDLFPKELPFPSHSTTMSTPLVFPSLSLNSPSNTNSLSTTQAAHSSSSTSSSTKSSLFTDSITSFIQIIFTSCKQG